jgi:hypothetical protein
MDEQFTVYHASMAGAHSSASISTTCVQSKRKGCAWVVFNQLRLTHEHTEA